MKNIKIWVSFCMAHHIVHASLKTGFADFKTG